MGIIYWLRRHFFEITTDGGRIESDFSRRIMFGARIMSYSSIAIAFFCINMLGTNKNVDTSKAAKEALKTHTSTTLAAGTRIIEKDDSYIGGDITIKHSSDKNETTLCVWDYAAEDGDYVQIFIDGAPLGDPFMIRNEPVSFKVPAAGKVKVAGIRDGGGGITYGVYCEANKTSYFNGMSQGGSNIYNLTRE